MYEAGAKPGARGFAAALNTCLGAGAVQQMREFVMEVGAAGTRASHPLCLAH